MFRWLLIFAAGFVCLAARECHRTAADRSTSLHFFINADTLFPASLYEDLFVDGYSWKGWTFSSATDFYPDVLVYFSSRAITGAVGPGMILSSIILFVLLLLSIRAVLAAIGSPLERRFLDLIVLLLGAVYLFWNALVQFNNLPLAWPLVLTYHAGAMICTNAGLAIVISLWKATFWKRKHWLLLVALFVHAALCTASDRLLVVQFIVPAIVALAGMQWLVGRPEDTRNSLSWHRPTIIVLTLVMAAVAGFMLLRTIQPGWQDRMSTSVKWATSLQSLRYIAETFLWRIGEGDLLHLGAALLVTVCAWITCGVIRRRLATRQLSEHEQGIILFSFFYLGMTIASIGAVGWSGRVQTTADAHMRAMFWSIDTRYFLPVLVLPYFVLVVYLLHLSPIRIRSHLQAIVACALVTLACGLWIASMCKQRADEQEVWNYYPQLAMEVDMAADYYGLTRGFAAYWDARVITLFSRRNVRVLPIRRHLDSPAAFGPMTFLGNREWYFRESGRSSSAFEPTFVIANVEPVPNQDHFCTPSPGEFASRFGEPRDERTIGTKRLVVEPGTGTDLFRKVATLDAQFLIENTTFRIGMGVRFPGGSLFSDVVQPTPGADRLAIEGSVPPGILVSGPNTQIPRTGCFRVRAETTSVGVAVNGRLDVLLHDPATGERRLVVEKDCLVGKRQVAEGFFQVDSSLVGQILQIRVHWYGRGSLEVHHIEIVRDP